MPQNPTVCATSIQICKLRATRLNPDGSLKAGANGHVVSDKTMMLEVKPNVLSGEQKNMVSGCDCLAVQYRGKDKLLHFDLTLHMTALEPALLELLTGAPLRTDLSTVPVAIGNEWPNQLDCSQPVQAATAIEVWTNAQVSDRQVDPPFQYYRWIWPSSYWQISNFNLENDFMQLTLDGYTKSNPNFANAYGDWPPGVTRYGPLGGFFLDSIQPIAVCGYSGGST